MKKLAIIPKNKTGGIVSGTIMGVGILVVATILILVVTSTVKNANLIGDDLLTTVTVSTNETLTISGAGISSPVVATSSPYFKSWNATRVMNCTVPGCATGSNETLKEGTDYIINANGSLSNRTKVITPLKVTYTWVNQETYSKNIVNNLSSNFTSGIDNVSSKIPTILLIVAVVFLFGALVLLVRYASGMTGGLGGGAGSL